MERWEDLSQELRDAILRVGTGELTADEAAAELRNPSGRVVDTDTT